MYRHSQNVSLLPQPTLPAKYLRPFRTNSSSCATYAESLDCLGDAACAWCRRGGNSGGSCVPRTETKSCDGYLETDLGARPSCGRKVSKLINQYIFKAIILFWTR